MDVIALAKINELKKSGGVGYTENTKKTLLPEQTFQAERLSAGLYMFDLLSPLEIIESDKVTVNWNGKQYTCEAISFEAEGETAVVFGDMAIMDGNVNTGEPFFYASRAGLGTFFTTDNGTVTVSVTAETETVHTVDPKFLPSGCVDLYFALGMIDDDPSNPYLYTSPNVNDESKRVTLAQMNEYLAEKKLLRFWCSEDGFVLGYTMEYSFSATPETSAVSIRMLGVDAMFEIS